MLFSFHNTRLVSVWSGHGHFMCTMIAPLGQIDVMNGPNPVWRLVSYRRVHLHPRINDSDRKTKKRLQNGSGAIPE